MLPRPQKTEVRRLCFHKDDGQPRLTVIMFGKRELRRHCRKLGLLIPVKMQARRFVSHKDDGQPRLTVIS